MQSLFLGQLWKIENSKLRNDKNDWNSDGKWSFEETSSSNFFIRKNVTISNQTVTTLLTKNATNDECITEPHTKGNDSLQIWIKGTANSAGFFTLINPSSPSKVLTAIPGGLQLIGKYTRTQCTNRPQVLSPKKILEDRSVQDLKIAKRTSKDLFFFQELLLGFSKWIP